MPAIAPVLAVIWAPPDSRLLFVVNLVTVGVVVLFAAGVIHLLLQRSYRRRVEEQRLAAMGTATARILHQIKNPLQTILLHTDLLNDPRVLEEPQSREEVCEAIVTEAQRLTALLGELSLYAAGARRHLSPEPFPLHELLRSLARREEREGRVQVEADEVEEAVVLADSYYLQQAVENLIVNAHEAMRDQPEARITLRLKRQGGTAVLEVADSGPGIPPEQLSSIFEPFVSTKSKGMGLGLSIVREIVEGHGGRIEVRSPPNSGARFRILLPLHAQAEVEARTTIMGGVS